MNPIWLYRNVINSLRYADTFGDAIQRLRLIYSSKLPVTWQLPEYEIGFRYRDPLGRLRFILRANQGADGFIFGEVFEHEYYRLPLCLAPNTILDLGANAGFTAVYFSRLYPKARIACVEPVPGNLRALKCNLQLNRVEAKIIAAAADVENRRVTMELHALDYAHKILARASAKPTGATSTLSTIEVDAFTVPTIMQQLGWEKIDLLKVDIEGHENILLSKRCEWLNKVGSMCIECHGEFSETDLHSLAGRFGFASVQRLPGIWFLMRTKNIPWTYPPRALSEPPTNSA